jgi:4a-hydroxytetrahydrobiopterin dehydratase
MKLSDSTCVACNTNEASVSDAERVQLLAKIPHWALNIDDDVMQLERTFMFKDFKLALAFTDRVGEIAEAEFHHPSLLTQWGSVTVTWWTHVIGGLHKNDFIMAARTDELFTNNE